MREVQKPVSRSGWPLIVKQTLAEMFTGVRQSEGLGGIWVGVKVTSASTITMGLDLRERRQTAFKVMTHFVWF